ncbi:MAG: tetratricopeptide repeat protein [Planctomycetota bacterium]|nr:tetratricopeptide repeat protein [Planctomycetota bacterium]
MIVRAKTKRRLTFLVVGAVLIATVLATAVVLLKQRRTRYFMGQRETGMTAYKNKDYATAISSLAIYIGRYAQDADAVYTLADAQKQSDSPDGRNLLVCAQLYRRFLELKPDRHDVRRDLVLLYSKLGFSNEVIDFAKPLLERNPSDVPILVARAKALAALRDYKPAMVDSKKAIELSPMEVEAQAITLELLGHLDRKPEVLPHAQAILEAHPGDARAELLMSIACLTLGELTAEQQAKIAQLVAKHYPATAQDKVKYPDASKDQPVTAQTVAMFFIRQAALHPVPELYFARILVGQLDRLRLPVEATEALDRALQSEDDPPLRRVLVRRFFEIGRYAEVEKRLANVHLRTSGVDLEMHAMKAISLVGMGRKAEATPIADQLAAVPNDRVARAWSVILKQAVIARGEPLQVIEAVRAALEVQKTNPYLRYYLGEAYSILGERDLAIDAWRQVNAYAPLWPLPLVYLSRLFLEDGQPQYAREAARAAAELTLNATTYANLAAVWAASVSKDEMIRDPDLQKLLAGVQQAMPGEERTLPVHIVVLAKSGKRAEAEKALRDALDAKIPPSESLLLKLASASREAELGQEAACYALAEKHYGLTPGLALTRAVALAADGKVAEGATLLDPEMQKKPTTQPAEKLAWRLNWAQYLDQYKDPRAAAAWKSLVEDANLKDNLQVQRAALAAPSVQSNREFMSRTIERLRAITGEQAAGWRLARTEMLVNGKDPTKAELEEAVKLLGQVVASAPNHSAESRQSLASIHARLGNSAAAIEQLLAALKLKPQSDVLMLDLARLYLAQSDAVHAREQMDRIRPQQLDPKQRQQLIRLLMQMGDNERAAKLLETQATPTTNPTDNLMLAELYRRRNQPEKAEPLYREMLKSPTPSAIVAAASFFASTGRKAEAERVLGGLPALTLDPGIKELAYADYYAMYGTKEQATEQYKAAVKAGPRNAMAWRAMLVNHVRNGRIDDALAGAAEASAAVPTDKVFEEFRANAKELKTVASDGSFVPLIIWVLQSRGDANAAIEAIRIGANAMLTNQPPSVLVGKLRPIADRSPGLVPLQTLLIVRCIAADRMDDAVAIAQRSIKAAPASADLAQLAAEVLFMSGDFAQAIAAARQWRELSLNQPMPADLFIAEMHLRQGNADRAAESIAPHLQAAIAKPDDFKDVLVMRANILLNRGQYDQVRELLWPSVSRSASWRKVWFELILSISGNSTVATSWLERVSTVIPESADDERILLAQIWQTMGQRSNDPQLIEKAKAILNQIAARPEKSPELLFSLAVVEESTGNLEEAEKLYRRALEMKPDFAAVQNNLAMVIANRNGNLPEAMTLAAKAVQAMPNAPAFCDTLGQVQAKSKDYKGAIASLTKAVQLEPRNPLWQINLASVYDQAGQKDKVEPLLRQIDSALKGKQIPPAYQAKLDKLRADLPKKPATTVPSP